MSAYGTMLTYQDLEKCTTEEQRRQFINNCISAHESSEMFKTGTAAGQFYRHRDPDLEAMRRYVYDRTGQAFEDTYSADHRITSNWFYLLLTQTVMYLLGNGISFDDPDIKEALSGNDDFDYATQKVTLYAGCDGEAYAYVSDNGIEPLCYACRIDGNEPTIYPIKDENDGSVKAAVRHWRLDPNKPRKITLYELDGYTEYTDTDHGLDFADGGKKRYNSEIAYNDIQGAYYEKDTSLGKFPIVKMPYINNQSALIGNRELIFAYDLVFSSMINKMDMNAIYWILKNADAMSKQDDVNFIVDLLKTKVLHLQDGQEVTMQEINTNTAAFEQTLAELRKQLFQNFMCIDTEMISAGNVTATQIKTSYQNADLQANALERCVSEFIRDVLEVRGFDRNAPFHFTRDKAINESEHVGNLIQSARYFDSETVTRALATTLGMIDDADSIIERKQQEAQEMFMGGNNPTTETEENVGGM